MCRIGWEWQVKYHCNDHRCIIPPKGLDEKAPNINTQQDSHAGYRHEDRSDRRDSRRATGSIAIVHSFDSGSS